MNGGRVQILFTKHLFRFHFWCALLLALPLARADDSIWTESVRSKDGVFAVSIDAAQKSILLLRADQRDLGSLQLRVLVLYSSSPPLAISLRRIENADGPTKYSAAAKDWDGQLSGFTLQSSRDGQSWKDLGTFRKPPKP